MNSKMRPLQLSASEVPPDTERIAYTSDRICCPTCGGVGTVVMLTMPKSMENGSQEQRMSRSWTGLHCVCAGAFSIVSAVGVWLLGAVTSSVMTMRFALWLGGTGIALGWSGCGV